MENRKSNFPGSAKGSEKSRSGKKTFLKYSLFMRLFENRLKYFYWTENALLKAIPKMIKNATSEELNEALTSHLEETKGIKNLINFKSILVYSICIAGTLFFISSCSESRSTDSRDVAEQENIEKMITDDKTIRVIENDAKFLMDAAEMQLEIISLGKLAQQKGSSTHVKELGEKMEAVHAQLFTEIKSLAHSKSVSIPRTITDYSKDAYKNLDNKTGNDFDKAYSDKMVKQHEEAIKLFEKASADSEDPEIRSWASNKLQGLKTHLKYAEECKEKCDKM